MKALSLKQPYAELIVSGKKTIETRTWNTKFRGTFLIHASSKPNETRMLELKFNELQTSCIVGQAEIVDVKEYNNLSEWNKDNDKHCAPLKVWDKKRYGYILKNAKRIKPIPCKGKLNFFEV